MKKYVIKLDGFQWFDIKNLIEKKWKSTTDEYEQEHWHKLVLLMQNYSKEEVNDESSTTH